MHFPSFNAKPCLQRHSFLHIFVHDFLVWDNCSSQVFSHQAHPHSWFSFGHVCGSMEIKWGYVFNAGLMCFWKKSKANVGDYWRSIKWINEHIRFFLITDFNYNTINESTCHEIIRNSNVCIVRVLKAEPKIICLCSTFTTKCVPSSSAIRFDLWH